MFGLVNRAIQSFVEDSYSPKHWDDVARLAGLETRDFEGMLSYADVVTDRVLNASGKVLGKRPEALLEDLGTYLVTHPHMEVVRRLLRYGGGEFEEFLLSLDELNDRVQIAIPDLEMPELTLRDRGNGRFSLFVGGQRKGYGALLLGLVQAMADDYGALVLMELKAEPSDIGAGEHLEVELLEAAFSQGRSFDLAAGMRGA